MQNILIIINAPPYGSERCLSALRGARPWRFATDSRYGNRHAGRTGRGDAGR
jgi:sulfur relay (sulfurtransferase) complex TusBCD TusD component (DsrE family)